MDTSYRPWPFLPQASQQEQWWEECFVTTPAITTFQQAKGVAILIGGPGSGKSVALQAWRRSAASDTLLVPYPPHNWPDGHSPRLPGRSHVGQVMAATATEIRKLLIERPHLFSQLSSLSQEFLCWLVRKHLGQRPLELLFATFRQKLEQPLETPTQITDIYATDTAEADVWSQIGELVDLAQALGFSRLALYTDLDALEAEEHRDELAKLLDWLNYMDYPGLEARVTIPLAFLKTQSGRTTGRLMAIRLDYDHSWREHILARHLRAATAGRLEKLAQIASPAILERIGQEVSSLYGEQSLKGWLDWSETLLYLQTQPQIATELEDIVSLYYQRHVSLRLDLKRFGVWRGPQYIELDRQPYELLVKLFELASSPSNVSEQALVELAGNNRLNLNAAMNRLREKIEPFYKDKRHIYVLNRRDIGYYLENPQ